MSAQVTSNEIPIYAFEPMKTLTQIYIHALSVEGIPQLIFLETVKRTELVVKKRVEDVRKQLCKASNGPPGGCTLSPGTYEYITINGKGSEGTIWN